MQTIQSSRVPQFPFHRLAPTSRGRLQFTWIKGRGNATDSKYMVSLERLLSLMTQATLTLRS